MRDWDFNTAAGKLEMGLKTLRATAAAIEERWTDQAHRQFQQEHLAQIDPQVRNMLDAISRLGDVLANAERQCSPE